MKKILFSMLAMAAMVSCSNENEQIDGINGKVEIKMTAGVGNVITKAAIGQGASGALSNDLGVFFHRHDGTTADWTALSPALPATIATAGTITFGTTQYYTIDGNKSHFFGYYPTGAATDGVITWDLDGTKDIIISDEQVGDKTTTQGLKFAFNHKLTLLKFKVKAENAVADEKITSITIKNQENKASYTPETKAFACIGSTDLATEAPTTNADITTVGIDGGTLLLAPASAEKELTLVVVTSKGTYNGKVTVECKANTSYVVTLTIKQQEVSGSATVGEWTTGAPGAGDII